MVLISPWRPSEVSCIPPGAPLCQGFDNILLKKWGRFATPAARGSPKGSPYPQGGPSIDRIKNAKKRPQKCVSNRSVAAAFEICKRLAMSAHV